MALVSKALAISSLTLSAIVGGRFMYEEKKCRANLPQEKIYIGDKSKKEAIVIGKHELYNST